MAQIRLLQRKDERGNFDCGNKILDDYLKLYAYQNQKRGLQETYVVVDDNDELILAYMTVAPGSGDDDLRRSCLLLLRLATDKRYQRQGYSAGLVGHAFDIAMSQDGCLGVILDSKAESVGFYLQLGFNPLGDIPDPVREDSIIPMFMPIENIRSIRQQ
jgi:GNAT superfamily N-acetyltransferase